MIKKKTVKVDIVEIDSAVCDVCKNEYSRFGAEFFEWQEFTHIRFTGGWSSVFGDGCSMGVDICQHCLKEKLGDYIREVHND